MVCFGGPCMPAAAVARRTNGVIPQVVPLAKSFENTVAAACGYLAGSQGTPEAAVGTLISSVASALKCDARFFSVPGGRGRCAFVPEEQLVHPRVGFLLVAATPTCESRHNNWKSFRDADADSPCGKPAARDEAEVLEMACKAKDGVASDGCMAAAVVGFPGEAPDGILLVRTRREDAYSDAGKLLLAVRLWALILRERLDRIHKDSELEAATFSLTSVLCTMEHLVARKTDLGPRENILPQQLLHGTVSLERANTWFLDGKSSEVVLNNSGRLDGHRIKAGESFVASAVQRGGGRVVGFPSVEHDPDFQKSADRKRGLRTGSSICVPLRHPEWAARAERDGVAVIQLTGLRGGHSRESLTSHGSLPEHDGRSSCTSLPSMTPKDDKLYTADSFHFDLAGAEALQNGLVPTAVQMRSRFIQLFDAERHREILRKTMFQLSSLETVTELVEFVEVQVAKAMDCQRCTLFFLDEGAEEIWTPPSRGMPQGICLDRKSGLVGHVATQAEKSSDMYVFTCNDPPSCPYWNGDVSEDGFETRNIMTAPVWSCGKDRRLLGVVQLLNKCHPAGWVKPDGNAGSHQDADIPLFVDNGMGTTINFTLADEHLLEMLVHRLGDHLQRLMLDMIRVKALMFGLGQSENAEKDEFLSEFYNTKGGGGIAQVVHGEPITESSRRLSKSVPEEIALVPGDALTVDINSWKVEYWNLTEESELKFITQALSKSEAFNGLQVPRAKFYPFVSMVRSGYKAVPYHNFEHALATMHFSLKLAFVSGAYNDLEQTDVFALAVGALGHDIGHRGYNNHFEIASRSDLAVRYNDVSVLENHHCARLFEIACSGSGECDIFRHFTSDTYAVVRKRIVHGILGTDMKNHGEFVKTLQNWEPEPGITESQSLFLVELFLHSADIGNVVMPHDISAEFGQRIAEEFSAQVEAEKRLQLPVTAFMDGLQSPIVQAKSQLGFIDFVARPLFDRVFHFFPELVEPKACFEENRAATAKILEDDSPRVTKPKSKAKRMSSQTNLRRRWTDFRDPTQHGRGA